MISITCTQCRTVLTIDDAFAGGVCRCQHCGTIQTVPKSQSAATSSTTTSKALYQNQSGPRTTGGNVSTTGTTSPSGLDDLAQAVVSSGLSGSGLRSAGLSEGASNAALPPTPQAQWAAPDSPRKKVEKKKPPIIPIAIAGGVVLAGVIVWLVIHFSGGGGSPSGAAKGGSGAPVNGTFSGVSISGPSVVYVIDRASSLNRSFPDVKTATVESIRSLGTDGQFAVILWNNDTGDISLPPDKGFLNATANAANQVEKELEPVQATGASTLRDALDRAVARKPASIVILTGKFKLDADDESALSSAKQAGQSIKFYAFSVDVDNTSFKLAAGPNFQYKLVSKQDLH